MTAPTTATESDALTPSGRLARVTGLQWVQRFEFQLLAVIAVVAAIARAGGFSAGTLYRDDAWVALTTRVPLGTAARMVVTTPGFVLGERTWIGWFPHSVALDQLPTFLASVLGVVAVGRLARWWGLSAAASLVAAGVVAVAYSDVVYATRVKPYAFDLLGACLILWLAERVRRRGPSGAPWLAVASACVCAFSLTPVPLVAGVWVALGVEAVFRRELSIRLVASGVGGAVGLGALWLAVRGGISPRLRDSWDGYYLVVRSAHGFAHSVRTIVDGLVRGVGDTTPNLGIKGLGLVDRVVLLVLGVLGLGAWRRQLLGIAAILAALVLTIPRLVPLGTGRTDAYLYPAIAMLVAEGATLAWHGIARFARPLLGVALAGSLVVAGLLCADRVLHRPTYPGGNFRVVAARLNDDLAHGELVVVGGTTRWPWAYYEEHHVHISYSDLYNNGYTVQSDQSRVLLVPGTAIEGGYQASVDRIVARVRDYCGGVAYVESDDWPSMPMTLLDDMSTDGNLKVLSASVLDGYRYWTLATTAPCPPQH